MIYQNVIEDFPANPSLASGTIRELEPDLATVHIEEIDPAQFSGRKPLDEFGHAKPVKNPPRARV
jgi:hypothetical protein